VRTACTKTKRACSQADLSQAAIYLDPTICDGVFDWLVDSPVFFPDKFLRGLRQYAVEVILVGISVTTVILTPLVVPVCGFDKDIRLFRRTDRPAKYAKITVCFDDLLLKAYKSLVSFSI
jgi:hypothetical protein